MRIKLGKFKDFFVDEYRQLQEEQNMNPRQGGLYPTANADIGITAVGATLEQLAISASDNSKKFTQIVEMNKLLTRKLKGYHEKIPRS